MKRIRQKVALTTITVQLTEREIECLRALAPNIRADNVDAIACVIGGGVHALTVLSTVLTDFDLLCREAEKEYLV